MGHPLLKRPTLSPANSTGCPPPATTASRSETSTRLWLVHPGLSLEIAPSPALLHLSPSRLSACGKGLGSSYPSSQPRLRSRLGGTGSPCAVWFHYITLVSPCEVLSTHHRGWCTSSLCATISQPQKAVTVSLKLGRAAVLFVHFCSLSLWVTPGHIISAATEETNFFFFSLCSLFVLNKILRSSASP